MSEHEIDDIDRIGTVTKKRFHEIGYESVEDLAETPLDTILEDIENTEISDNQAKKASTGANSLTVTFTSGSEAKQEYMEAERVPTGLDHLDEAIDGGLTRGQFQGVSGETGTGKTQISFKAMVSAIEATNQDALYIETEPGRFSSTRLETFASEDWVMDHVHRVEAHTLEQQRAAYNAILNRYQGEELALIAIDSFNGAFRNSGRYDGREHMPARNEDMRQHLRKVQNMADEHNVPILMANQVYSGVDTGSHGKTVTQREGNIWGSFQYKHQLYFNLALRGGQGDQVTRARIRNHPECGPSNFNIKITDEYIKTVDP